MFATVGHIPHEDGDERKEAKQRVGTNPIQSEVSLPPPLPFPIPSPIQSEVPLIKFLVPKIIEAQFIWLVSILWKPARRNEKEGRVTENDGEFSSAGYVGC